MASVKQMIKELKDAIDHLVSQFNKKNGMSTKIVSFITKKGRNFKAQSPLSISPRLPKKAETSISEAIY